MGRSGRVFLIRGIKPGIWGSSGTKFRWTHVRTLKEPTNESDIDTAWGEGAALGGPSEAVLENPGVESGLCLGSQPQVWIRNTLEDVVVVLCRPEDGRAWVRNVPGDDSQAIHHAVKISGMHTKQHRHLEQTRT